jgi:hypothetical protein
MSDLRTAIAKLEKLNTRLRDPLPFYRQQSIEWRELARRIVEQTLVSLQPANVTTEEWQHKIVEISARVSSAYIFNDREIGITLSIAPRIEFDPANEDPRTFTIGNLSIQDVERWVAEGRVKTTPDAPGKNFKKMDADKTDLQIAWRIMYALKLQKDGWDRLLGHLRDFAGLEAEDAAEALYPELLKAWLEHFTVRCVADWRRYIQNLIATA